MNIQSIVEPRLWQVIERSYEDGHYKNAILDAVYHVSDLIRERTGLESDGVTLVGQAFGGKNPKLKVNRLQNESEWSVQRGVEQLLRGLYQAIRNPRSHGQVKDNAHDAVAILLFVNYLIRIITESKPPFVLASFIKRVIDKDFVEDQRYAELLVTEIPPKKRVDVFNAAFERCGEATPVKLAFFLRTLFAGMSAEEKKEVLETVSSVLKETNEAAVIRTAVVTFEEEEWVLIDEVARLRIENKLVAEVTRGKYDVDESRCTAGSLGSWTGRILSVFSFEEQLLDVVRRKLESGNIDEQDFVFRFLLFRMVRQMAAPPKALANAINRGLSEGRKRFYDAVVPIMEAGPVAWRDALGKAYEDFTEVPERTVDEDDDLPF